MSIFSDRLDELLHKYDMNRSQLSRRIGVDVSTVHRWFKRGSVPVRSTVTNIANIFGVDEGYLYGTNNDPIRTIDIEPFIRTFIDEASKEDSFDEDLIRLIQGLNPQQVQRVKDFIAGLKCS